MVRNLKEFIELLRQEGELLEVNEYVDPVYEITEITDRFSTFNRNKALLFHQTGTKYPVVTNLLGSEKRLCLALRVNSIDEIAAKTEQLFQLFKGMPETFTGKISLLFSLKKWSSFLPKKNKGKGVCQQHILNDLEELPVIKCWPLDGGKFITLPMVHTKDPVSGKQNLGMYRMQLFEKNKTGMHWHKHKDGASHFSQYKQRGEKMPVAVALGGDPLYAYCATAPLPENIDEYILAGLLREAPVRMVKCLTQDIWVPEDVDFVIEGYVDPEEAMLWEGPFGDHTGFYSMPDWYPAFHVTCITCRKDAVYPATIVGIPPQEDYWLAKATERLFLPVLKNTILPELVDMDLPEAGVGHNITIVGIESRFPGHGAKVMHALWGAGQMMFNKLLVIVDKTLPVNDYSRIGTKIFSPGLQKKYVFRSRGPLDMLDHATDVTGYGGKLCFDISEMPDIHFDYKTKSLNLIESIKNIVFINDTLMMQDIRLFFAGIKKENKHTVSGLIEQLLPEMKEKQIAGAVFVDDFVKDFDVYHLIWYAANNLRADKDIYFREEDDRLIIFFDCTKKTKEMDDYLKEWPEIISSDKDTMTSVDNKWKTLGLGEFIPSPSKKIGLKV